MFMDQSSLLQKQCNSTACQRCFLKPLCDTDYWSKLDLDKKEMITIKACVAFNEYIKQEVLKIDPNTKFGGMYYPENADEESYYVERIFDAGMNISQDIIADKLNKAIERSLRNENLR